MYQISKIDKHSYRHEKPLWSHDIQVLLVISQENQPVLDAQTKLITINIIMKHQVMQNKMIKKSPQKTIIF